MKKFIFLIILCGFTINLIAQDDGFYGPSETTPKESKKLQRQKKLEKWSFGGNFWASFSSNSYVEISPIVFYRATPRLLIGPGFTYIYEKSRYYEYETSSYGPRAMINYSLFTNLNEMLNINIGNIVLHSEYELLNIEKIGVFSQGGSIDLGRTWVNSLLIGGGIYQPLGARGGISFLVLYNVIENDFSPYTNPVFRLGFFF